MKKLLKIFTTFKSLDPKLRYKLTKLKQNKPSAIGKGASVIGGLSIYLAEELNEFYVIVTGKNYNDYIKTSGVEEIIKKTKNSITFETQTSVYRLEEFK